MNIRARLLLLVSLATLLPAGFIGVRFVQDRAANVEAAMRNLERAANSIAMTIADRIRGTAQLHYGLARARDLDTNDKAACSSFLSAVREAYPQYTGILTITPDGQLFCDSLRTGRTLDLRAREYFKKALVATDGVTLEPVFGQLTGISVLQIAYPVRAESGSLKFVLLASLNLDNLVQQYNSELPQPIFDIVLTDTKGTVLVGKPSDGWKDRVGTSIADTGIFRFSVAHPDGGAGEVSGFDGSQQVWAVAGIPEVTAAGVRVMVGMTRDNLLMAANNRLREDLSILSGAFLILFAGVWLLADLGIRKPIGRIALMAEKLGRGDLGARIPPPYPRGELGGLMAILNSTAEALERQRTDIVDLNSKLRQAQKMEVTGQLTGGLAHDFNNILTVIIGMIELMAEAVADDPELASIAKVIDEAAERGAELTRQLLAFARKQPLQPREIDINSLLIETVKLLRPTLGEHIEIESMLEENIWPALVDPGQLSTALLNLALNARDAMPNGGKLTLETDNAVLDESYARMHSEVEPGAYVMIALSDTGSGIPAAVRDRVFEPFFTTKDVGKGTGLGLSMVYGFVKQSGGHINIYSEEGHGTTIKLYLPRAGEHANALPPITPVDSLQGGRDSILVVEDDPLVRNYVVAQLENLGYVTLVAANAAEALQIIDQGSNVDLLFTDVIMAGTMNGPQLADEIVKRRPAIKVLYTSGYTENAIVHHGRLDPGVLLLPKPYRRADLARMIRMALS